MSRQLCFGCVLPRTDTSQHRMKRRCSLSSQRSLPEPSRARTARRVTCAASEGLSELFLPNLWEQHRQRGGEPGPQPFGDRGALPQPVPAGVPAGDSRDPRGRTTGARGSSGAAPAALSGGRVGAGPLLPARRCPAPGARRGPARPGPAAAPPRCRRRPHSRW